MTKCSSLLLALLLAVAACGTSLRETVINPAPRPMAPRPPETVEMFTSGAPARPHVDVAFFEAEEASSFSTAETADMMNKLRKRAADRGCDAIVVGGLSSRDPGMHDAETFLVDNPKGRKGIYGTCIVYTESAPPPVATQAP